MIIILFGLAGSGKNFVGNILKQEFGFHFVDADDFLTDEMKNCIAMHRPFEQPMRDRYTELVIQKIKELQVHHPNLAISKALYKEQNRHDVMKVFPQALLIQVESYPEIIADRIGTREHLINESFAKLISQGFEPPAVPHEIISNNSDKQAVIKQLQTILEKRKV